MKLSSSVISAIEQETARLGYETVEVRYATEYGQNALTVFIDRKEGIGLDDCERVSVALDPLLDELDPTQGVPYNLNVSSAGLDRPIKNERDFARNMGRDVEAKLFAPLPGTKTKLVCGVLKDFDGNLVTIEAENGSDMILEKNKIALLTQQIKFD